MMELPHQAIILLPKTAQNSYYLFFDKQLGTIEVRLDFKKNMHNLARGSLVEYTLKVDGSRYRATSIDIVAVPDVWVVNNIWFLHHVLELIDFFLPRNSRAEEIFMLSSLLYQPLDTDIDTSFFKKFFLCKFFILVGLYPEPTCFEDRQFLSLISSDSEYIGDKEKYVFLEKKMIQWLHECIRLHPYANRLKTKIMEPWYGYKKNNIF